MFSIDSAEERERKRWQCLYNFDNAVFFFNYALDIIVEAVGLKLLVHLEGQRAADGSDRSCWNSRCTETLDHMPKFTNSWLHLFNWCSFRTMSCFLVTRLEILTTTTQEHAEKKWFQNQTTRTQMTRKEDFVLHSVFLKKYYFEVWHILSI